jgi:hypothetical protein
MKPYLFKLLTPITLGLTACLLVLGILLVGSSSSARAAPAPIAHHSTALRVSATVTPSVRLPIVIGGVNLKNGGFEQGAATAWITQSASGSDALIYMDADLLDGTSPHTGDWAAWLGGRNNENAILRQTVLVPASAPYLTYWQMIASNEPICGADVARVLINDVPVPGSETGLCAGTATKPAWERKSLDLRTFAGQNVRLDFNLTTDGNLPSSWLLDDIAFSVTP